MRILVDVCIRQVCESRGMIDDKRRFCDTYVTLPSFLFFSMNISVEIVERKLKNRRYTRHIYLDRENLKERLDFDAQNLKVAERKRFFHSILYFLSLSSSIPEHLYFIKVVSNELKSTKLKYACTSNIYFLFSIIVISATKKKANFSRFVQFFKLYRILKLFMSVFTTVFKNKNIYRLNFETGKKK